MMLVRGADSATIKCNQDLLISYGLEGVPYAQQQTLDMCKFVENSCCKVSDQLSIYANWETSGEAKNLQDRFKFHRDTYFDLLDLLEKVGDLAHRVLDRLADRRVSNCKVLAKRILHFQVKEIAPKLKDTISSMHDFFYNTYQGFYCTICDGDSQKFFNPPASKVLFSQKFCRDLTANSLHVLLYFHVHFLKYMNLVARFVTSCDHKGNFEEKPIDKNLNFVINHARRAMLEECKLHRNDGNWFEFCFKLCEEFNMVKFTKFFEPNIKEFSAYTVLVEELIEEIEEAEEREKQFLESVGKGDHRVLEEANVAQENASKARILNEAAHGAPAGGAHHGKEITPERLAQVKNEFTNPLIFKSGLNAIVDLGEFTSRFDDPGIDYYDHGKQSIINDQVYKSVRSVTKVNGGSSSRNLNYVSVLATLSFLAFLAL